MNGSAWAMMLITWAVILFFTGKFFVKVLRTPSRPDDDSEPDSAR